MKWLKYSIFIILCLACGEDNSDQRSTSDVIQIDSNAGMTMGDPIMHESGTEIEEEAGIQAGEEAGLQAGEEAGLQAGEEAGAQSGEEAGIQAGEEAGEEAGVQAGEEAGEEAGVQAGEEAGEEAGTEMMGIGVCDRLRSVIDQTVLPIWTGNSDQCMAGEMGLEAQESVLRITNFYRSLANLNPVSLATQGQQSLQECALMMDKS